MRVFSQRVYGIPPEQVVGSSGKVEFQLRDGTPVLVKLPDVQFVDDKAGKPVGIYQFIGPTAHRRSDGDLQMLRWTTSGTGARLGVIIHHTDAAREYAYDRTSKVGKLDKALDAASGNGWIVVDMKQDWNRMFPGN